MKRKDTVTRTVQILDILPGDPSQILTGEHLRRNGKPGRLFQQLVPVLDGELLARLSAQVSKGDTISVTVTTEWCEDEYRSYLSDFALCACTAHEVPQEALT